jgi:hypothetical protein
MHEKFLVAGLMYIKSRDYMLCIIYSVLSVKNNHEWVCSLHKYIQNFGWKTFSSLQEVLKSLGRSRQRWEYNISMDCKERGLNGVHWFHMPQDRVKIVRLLWIWYWGFMNICPRGSTRACTQTHMKALELTTLYKVRKLN